MIRVLSTNITSPLGMTTEENYQAVRAGRSALMRYTDRWHLQEPFCASLFTEEQLAALHVDGLTSFESAILHSVKEALAHMATPASCDDINTPFDITSPRVVFILSTTKGNIDILGQSSPASGLASSSSTSDFSQSSPASGLASSSSASDFGQEEAEYPGSAAQKVATALGITTEPIVVCNACISGVAAQILAQRLLDAGLYDYAIVAGAEVQSKFIVSGFEAFKAVTDEPCRPFDIERLGLNLGDAAATMIFTHSDDGGLISGCIRNDAYHLSAPHPQGEGYMLAVSSALNAANSALNVVDSALNAADSALNTAMPSSDFGPHNPVSALATIGVHGTATMYNDQMESKAIQRAGLSDIPVTSLKGYYGHTMGAAGLLETIITLCATRDGIVLPARGFEEIGVSGKINISNQPRTTDKHDFLKMLSGFGGCNGAVYYKESGVGSQKSDISNVKPAITHTITITPTEAIVDGTKLDTTATGKALLKELYKSHINDYPKFFKMDALTRLTFVASELLLKAEGSSTTDFGHSRAVIIFNRSSSIVADRAYYETIRDDENFYPSPAAFLYTLPNLTTGEIAIRNHYYGETSFYILPEKNDALINDIISVSFMDRDTTSVIGGWIDCPDEDNFKATLNIYTLL